MRLPSFRRGDATRGEDVPPVRRSEYLSLALVVLAAFVYHYLQARGRVTPWVFPDELQYAESARAFAETGMPVVRGEGHLFGSLRDMLLAPAWLANDPATAWALTKLTASGFFAVSAVPVYFIVRSLRCRRTALAATAVALLVPAAFYGSTLLAEPLAMPFATFGAFATFRLLSSGSRRWLAVLALLSVAGVLVRTQLAVLPVAAAASMALALASGRTSSRARRRLVSAVAVCAIGGAALATWSRSSEFSAYFAAIWDRPGDVLAAMALAGGATAVALGILPAVSYIAALGWLAPRQPRPHRAFAAVLGGFGAVFLVYTGVKTAVLSGVWLSIPEERNLIYLEPLAIASLAVVGRRAGRVAWVVGATVVLLVVAALPIDRIATSGILSETPGLSWVWHARSVVGDVGWFVPMAVVVLVLGTAAVALVPRGHLLVLGAVGAALAATGSLAYRGDHSFSREIAGRWLGHEPSWIDRRTGGERTAIVTSTDVLDMNGMWSLGFWNRSIRDVADPDGLSLWGTHPTSYGLGTRGSLQVPLSHWVFAPSGMEVPGSRAETHPQTGFRLVRAAQPATLAARVLGRYPDGWVGDHFSVTANATTPAGSIQVELSAQNAFVDKPRRVGVTVNAQRRTWTLVPGRALILRLPVPQGPWALYFDVTPAESPLERGGGYDPRRLGALLGPVAIPGISRRL